jgi:hypothetical protein
LGQHLDVAVVLKPSADGDDRAHPGMDAALIEIDAALELHAVARLEHLRGRRSVLWPLMNATFE